MVDAETVADVRRRLGRSLAAHRRAAGLNQEQLAAQIGYRRSTVANVETGRQRAARPFWEGCDKALGVAGALVRGHEELEALVRDHHRARAVEEAAVYRRDAAKLLALLPMAGAGPMVDAVERIGVPHIPVDRKLIAGHQEIAEKLAGLYRSGDPRAALPMAVSYADSLLGLLDAPMGDREYRELTQIAVGVHAQVGLWACHLSRPAMAHRHLATACDLAASTRDPALHARALGAFSYLFSSAPRGGRGGRPRRALALLDAALTRAERSDGYTVGWLATWRADQHAALGNLRAARADIKVASAGLSSGRSPQISGFFSRSNYGYGMAGHVVRLRSLITGLHGETNDLDSLSNEMMGATTNMRHQVGALGYLATICVTAGEAERACETLEDALGASLSTGYGMGIQRAVGVRARFPRVWAGLECVRELDGRLRLLAVARAVPG